MESDYHDAMNAECYEKYFENVCKLLKPRSVIIIDNASDNITLETMKTTQSQPGERQKVKNGFKKITLRTERMH